MKTLRQSRIALTRGADPRAETEICLLMLAAPSLSENTDALYARVANLEKKIENATQEHQEEFIKSERINFEEDALSE